MNTGRPLIGVCFPSFFRKRRRQSGRDEIDGVGADGVDAFGLDILSVLIRQFESGSEFRVLDGGEGCGDLVGHILSIKVCETDQ
jgi:hypothetical protein